MNSKQTAGIAALIVGVILIAYGNHSSKIMTELTPARTSVISAPSPSGDHLVKIIGAPPSPTAKTEIIGPKFSRHRRWIVGGVILVLLGGGAMYYFGTRKKTK